jgi:DNA-binding transcriptional LysR family regulator
MNGGGLVDIRSMRFVMTLAQELHFGRAAQRHFISPQAFGRGVQRLEKELGVVLFARTSRRVELTAAGERYIHRAHSVLAAIDELSAIAADDPPADGSLLVGVLGFGLADHWSALRHAVTDRHPEVRLGYRDLDLASQYDTLLRGDVDVAVVQQVGPVDGLVFDPMLTLQRVAVVPAWSDLADAEHLSARDVDGREWLSMSRGAHPAFATWMGPASEYSRSAGVVRNPAGIPSAVATTGALGLHAEAASRFFPHPSVRFVPIEGDPCHIAIASRYRDDRPEVTAFRRAAALVAAG